MKSAAWLFVLFALLACPVLAEPVAEKSEAEKSKSVTRKPGEPEPPDILFIQNLKKIGADLYYLGTTAGLKGWLAVKDKQVQIIYATPDNRALLVGVLLSAEGANISQSQVLQLSAARPELQELLQSGAETVINPGVPDGQKKAFEEHSKEKESDEPASEVLFTTLRQAASATFGAGNAPQLIMVIDVNSTPSHQAWRLLQPLVDQGKLRLTMVPVQALGPQSAMDAAVWLSKKDPYEAWKQHVAGNSNILKTGDPDGKLDRAIFENTQLMGQWGVKRIPYLFYRGRNGKVRLIIGEPKEAKLIMDDIAPAETAGKKQD